MSATWKGYNSLKISGINLTSIQRKKIFSGLKQIFDEPVLNGVKTG